MSTETEWQSPYHFYSSLPSHLLLAHCHLAVFYILRLKLLFSKTPMTTWLRIPQTQFGSYLYLLECSSPLNSRPSPASLTFFSIVLLAPFLPLVLNNSTQAFHFKLFQVILLHDIIHCLGVITMSIQVTPNANGSPNFFGQGQGCVNMSKRYFVFLHSVYACLSHLLFSDLWQKAGCQLKLCLPFIPTFDLLSALIHVLYFWSISLFSCLPFPSSVTNLIWDPRISSISCTW